MYRWSLAPLPPSDAPATVCKPSGFGAVIPKGWQKGSATNCALMFCHPCGMKEDFYASEPGVFASLDPRLMADNPSGWGAGDAE